MVHLMDFTTLIAFLSFQLTIIALMAIVHNRDKLADKAIAGLHRLSGKLITKSTKQQTDD